ncbi:MAG: GNAT family N-acetyltransferase [Candidatus Kapaibacteriota bacterium]
MNIIWECKSFHELTAREVYDILKLREEVFIVEQQCIYKDIDDKDFVSQHILAYLDNQLIAYSRIIPGSSTEFATIGRIIVHKIARGNGYGKELVSLSITSAKNIFSPNRIDISAQEYLLDFYESFGFIINGLPYDLDGIPHIDMTLQLV